MKNAFHAKFKLLLLLSTNKRKIYLQVSAKACDIKRKLHRGQRTCNFTPFFAQRNDKSDNSHAIFYTVLFNVYYSMKTYCNYLIVNG